MPATDISAPSCEDDLSDAWASTLVVVPGTGSDADFARRAFGPAAASLGIRLIALQPEDDLIAGYRRRLTEIAAAHRRILVGGVSIGAAVALQWALGADGYRTCAGVWAALPAWSGDARPAVAAHSASWTARTLRDSGLDATIVTMRDSSPRWLADELTRSWRSLYPGLINQLECAATYRAPTVDDIAGLRAPLAITASRGDALHPLTVARAWCDAAPRAQLVEIGLDQWGEDPAVLGSSCADAWAELTRAPTDG